MDECDWLHFSLHLGGKQPGSDYNARFEYIFIKKARHGPPIGTALAHPLHQRKYDAITDRTIYDRWYSYNQQQYCMPGVVNPDLAIVARTVPTLYGEVESSHLADATSFERLDQCSARVLSYRDKCFSVSEI